MSERLNLLNIMEVNRIREILSLHPDLLSMFELLVIMGNNRINEEERGCVSMELETNIEPNLSSDSGDDELLTPSGITPSGN